MAGDALRLTGWLLAETAFGFALAALDAALVETALGTAFADFLAGLLFAGFALLFLAAVVAGALAVVLVALRAGALSAAERFFKGCGVAVLPAFARFLAEDVFEL
ncbi:MAG TPA: hypothetical protein VEQ40_12345 [Pyrinomonadaceae bacterium]|nr:hypothetical protein [Pyrinomonadaceae bacterium]